VSTTAEYLTCPGLSATHGFFTRRGGVSSGPYASLNCSLSSGDAPECVRENRARAARALGADPDALLGLTQVHGAVAVRVREGWPAGAGPSADAMVTDRPGFALGIVTADCAPVLLADRQAGVIGAAHAGWRGAVAGVLEATIAAMAALGATADRIEGAIGPCIAAASYEVGAEVRDAVLAADPALASVLLPGARAERWQFDLPGYCAARLAGAGVARVHRVTVDTCTDEARFFSHRRRTRSGGGPIGHQIAIITQ
jgi:YfiH family protein